METIVKALGLLALVMLVTTGCIFRAFEEQNKRDIEKNRAGGQTLAKASLILDAVQEWSGKHGGVLPDPTQFRNEVGPYVQGKSGADVSAADVEAAFPRFQWTFPGGPIPSTPSEVEVGHLTEPQGEAIAYADGSVRRWRTIEAPK
ncbi:MAG: hypothetical protein ACO1SV_14140 [Fimbriimonas sp.]